jgi:protein-disulfide isomerase
MLLVLGTMQSCTPRRQELRDLPGVGHERGDAGADIVIIEFADFACTACAQFAQETLPSIERDWIATGRARLRVLPFDALKSGRVAARAAECAGEQNAFWEMHDLLYARHKDWLAHSGQRAIFEGWAAELHLDMNRFRVCWNSNLGRKHLQRNTTLARTHGVPATPAFTVNGRPIVGALRYADFAAVLQKAAGRE